MKETLDKITDTGDVCKHMVNTLNPVTYKITITHCKNIFEKIKIDEHKIFIETGTYLGSGVKWGLKYFDKVISIEILDEYYDKAVKMFKDEDKLLLVKEILVICWEIFLTTQADRVLYF